MARRRPPRRCSAAREDKKSRRILVFPLSERACGLPRATRHSRNPCLPLLHYPAPEPLGPPRPPARLPGALPAVHPPRAPFVAHRSLSDGDGHVAQIRPLAYAATASRPETRGRTLTPLPPRPPQRSIGEWAHRGPPDSPGTRVWPPGCSAVHARAAPWDTHPGRDGASATKTSSSPCSTRTRYFIGASHRADSQRHDTRPAVHSDRTRPAATRQNNATRQARGSVVPSRVRRLRGARAAAEAPRLLASAPAN